MAKLGAHCTGWHSHSGFVTYFPFLISSEVLAPFASAHSNIKCLKVGDLEIYVSFVIYDGSKVVGNLADLIRCSNTMKENWVDSANLKRDLSTFCNIFHLQRYWILQFGWKNMKGYSTQYCSQQYIPLQSCSANFLLKKMITFLEPSRKRNFDGDHSQDESIGST